MTIQEAKIYGKSELTSSPTPELDTAVLLQHITGFDKTRLLLNRSTALTDEQESLFLSSIDKRKTGLPVAYITGHKEFFGYDFYVTPDVLIPKPDTELLVELALAAIEDKFLIKTAVTVCDMCTGSGCVGLSLAKKLSTDSCANECPENVHEVSFTMADISEKALAVAQKNAKRFFGTSERSEQCPANNSSLHIANCSFVQSNLFENIPHSFDLIVTNPPYVPHEESLELLKDGRSEPLLALDGDVDEKGESCGTNDGLALIRRLVPQCYEHLNPNGVVIMETGEYNAEETFRLFKQAGFRNVHIEYDMNEMMRDVIGIK